MSSLRLIAPGLFALAAACTRATLASPPDAPPAPATVAGGDTARVSPELPLVPLALPRPERITAWADAPAGSEHAPRVPAIDLLHQSIRLRFDRARGAVIGTTTLRLAAFGAPLDTIVLDAVGLRVTRVTDARGRALQFITGDSTLALQLAARLATGARTEVTVEYEALHPARGAAVPAAGIVWLSGGLSDSRHWVPTTDHAGERATWEIVVRAPLRESVLANGRLLGTRPTGADVEWRWAQERPVPIRLIAVATGEMIVLQDKWREIPVSYWTTPARVEATWRELGGTPRMIELFSTLTAVDYPWPKYDQAVAGPSASWIAAATLAILGAEAPADNQDVAVEASAPARESDDVARAVAMQWFDVLYPPASDAELWLADGAAAFFAHMFAEADRGVGAGADVRRSARERAMDADLGARRPLVFARWRLSPGELRASGHTSDRGALVLHMLRQQLGDSIFWRGVRQYMARRDPGGARTEGLRRAFEDAGAPSLASFFRQWVYGAGFPMLDVRAHYDSASRRLQLVVQQRQPRDSLTGFFDLNVTVRAISDRGSQDFVVPVRGETTVHEEPVPAAPRALRWDPDARVLQSYVFERPAGMLLHQLLHDDGAGRAEAARELAFVVAPSFAARDTIVTALSARRHIETDPVVLTALDAAIAALGRR